jgi:catechol 2,3-dioxygenase-like lactoylglutathione lyase family enzyme
MTRVGRLARFSLTTGGADRLGAFYEQALGFRKIAIERHSGARFESLMGVAGGARGLVLGLGEQAVELLEFAAPGRPYPHDAASSDLLFQHLAIVVADMGAAYQRLLAARGWCAITEGGPQRLPDASGGVTAFKFRDPEGHPLELLAFPEGNAPPPWRATRGAGPCLGIDHSAISVADSARSAAFYEALGFAVSARSHNHGPEQARLDGLHAPDVEVTALVPRRPTPHIELLGYRAVARGEPVRLRNNDVAAARLVLEASGPAQAGAGARVRRALFDPDGHHLLIDEPAEE